MEQSKLKKQDQTLNVIIVIAAISTGIAGFIHLYMPMVAEPRILYHTTNAIFFLGSGIAQLFWIIPMLKRWGKVWYYIGIIGNIAFILLYIITRIPGNPVTGRGGGIDNIDLVCEFAQISYIITTIIVIARIDKLKIKRVF